MKKSLVLSTAVILLLLFSVSAAAQNIPIDEITKISVEGNDYVSDFEILNVVTTEVGDQTDQEALRADMEAVFEMGYFSDVNIVFENFEGGLNVIFEIVENPVLTEINISGHEEIYSEEDILEALNLNLESVLNVKEMNDNLRKFQERMQDEGFILARYRDVNITEEGVLTVEISPGYLDSIEIRGNTKTKDDVILREMPVEVGDVVNIRRIQRGYQNLHRLEYFENINPELERIDADENLAKLVINLDESQTGRLNFGGGYSSTDGWLGFVDVSERNLFGNGQRIGAEWQFGDTTTYSLNFNEPYLFSSNFSFGFNIYDRERERSEYTRKTRGGSLTFGHPLPADWRTNLRYRVESAETNWVDENIEDEETDLRSLTLSFNRDTANSRFHPTAGSIINFDVEHAGDFIGGGVNFTKFNLDTRRYYSGFSDHAWALRSKIGVSYPRGDIPSSEQYVLGGSDTLRGYQRSDFERDDFDNNNLMLLNVEYRIPFGDSFTGVLFTDAGNVWEDRDSISLGDLNYGYGLGVRMNTPVGQLRLDYGWDEERDGQLHFSIGNTF